MLGLFAVRAAVGDLGAPAGQVWVQVGGLLACALAVWRPGPAAGCAVAVVSGSVVLGTGGHWDVLSTTLLCLLAPLGFRPRGFWLVVLGVAGYAGLLGSRIGPTPSTMSYWSAWPGLARSSSDSRPGTW